MTEEQKEPTGSKITRRELLVKSLKLGAGLAVGASLAKHPSTTEAKQTETIEEEELIRKVNQLNAQIVNPEGEIDWKNLAQERQDAFLTLIGKYPETARPLIRSDGNTQARGALIDHLNVSGITDSKDLEPFVEEEVEKWVGAIGMVSFHTRKPPDLYFSLSGEGSGRSVTRFRLYTSQPIETFAGEGDATIEKGIKVGEAILADPNAIT